MSAKRKAISSKDKLRGKRALYTWHLRPPFDKDFDHTNWWKNQSESDNDPAAALYEITRRHSLICACHVGGLDCGLKRYSFHPIRFLAIHGLKSWPRLGSLKQLCWKKVAGHIKGVDCRDDTIKCFSIETEAYGYLKNRRVFATKKYRNITVEKVDFLVEEDMIENPPLMRNMEAKIKEAAVKAFRNGYLLIAVAPDIATDNAESLMAKEFRQYRAIKGISKPRARWVDWLQLISDFEDSECRLGGAKSELFTRYRRIMDDIEFP